MLTVMDQASPWLTPNNRLAAMIQPQAGAQIDDSGTGMPIIQPAMAIRMRLRVNRWAKGPTSRLEAAYARPKVAMKETTAVLEVMPNSASARPGRMVRSMPIIPPTNMLVATNRAI